jgi:hypothetical protein
MHRRHEEYLSEDLEKISAKTILLVKKISGGYT